VSQVFPPLTITTSDYSGAITVADEWPPGGGGSGDRLQAGNTAAGAHRVATVSFDASASPNIAVGPIEFVMVHAGSQSGGWSVEAQFMIDGEAVGDPVTRVRAGGSGAHRGSVFHFSDPAIIAAAAADPDLIEIAWDATNLHGSNQQHLVDAVALVISPHADQPTVGTIDWDDVIFAADMAQSGPEYLTDGANVLMVPDLAGNSHVKLFSTTVPVYDDDDPDVASTVTLVSSRFATTLDVAAPGYDDVWVLHIARTGATLPTGDGDSRALMAGWSGAALGQENQYNNVLPAIAGASDGGISWLHMVGPVGAENDHIRGSNVDAPSADTWYIILCHLDPSGNDLVYVHEFDGDPITTSDLVLDGQAASGTNTFYAFGIGSRADQSRFWINKWSATWVFDASLVDEETAFDYANQVATEHGLVSGVEAVGQDLSTSWHVSDAISADLGVVFDVEDAEGVESVGANLSALWNVSDTVTDDLSLLWDVNDGGSVTAVSGDLSVLWNVEEVDSVSPVPWSYLWQHAPELITHAPGAVVPNPDSGPGVVESAGGYVSVWLLLSYLPSVFTYDPYIRDVMNAIATEFDQARLAIDLVLDGSFVEHCPEWALRIWEAQAGLLVDPDGVSLEDRRSAVRARIHPGPISYDSFLEFADRFFPGTEVGIVEDYADYAVEVSVYSAKSDEEKASFEAAFRRALPAHLSATFVYGGFVVGVNTAGDSL